MGAKYTCLRVCVFPSVLVCVYVFVQLQEVGKEAEGDSQQLHPAERDGSGHHGR